MLIRGLVEQFLGLNVEQSQEGENFCCKFSQPGLIDNILEATGMIKYNWRDTLTSSDLPLEPELGSKPAKKNFNVDGTPIAIGLHLNTLC
eukprot:2562348-Ditylum_brightwellii.AAC.1